MTPSPQSNAVARELGRLAVRLGLLERDAPDWTALARACGGSSAALCAVMAQDGQVDDETLFPLLDGILALTSARNLHYNPLPLLIALGVITCDELETERDRWRASLIRAEFSDDLRFTD